MVLNVCMSFWYQAFVSAQNQLTQPFLEHCEVRDQFKERMTELYDYPKYSCPFKRGSRWGEWTLCRMIMVLQRFVPPCWRSGNKASLPSLLGIFTFITQASKTRVWCMCRKAWMLNRASSWIQTLFLMMGPLLYEVWETLFIHGILTSFIFLEICTSLKDIYIIILHFGFKWVTFFHAFFLLLW